jgi:hypothetical protein
VGSPCRSSATPAGIAVPVARDHEDVAIGDGARRHVPEQWGASPARGQAKAMGLVPITAFRAPKGATRLRPLTMASAKNPASASGSISVASEA